MASPIVTTPSSAGSPAPATLAPAPPALTLKPNIGSSISMAMSTPAIVTQKEWVIPPRPKPGRKPATDTPPTKRKAQNRAAQRAFRERRAARVGELEEQLEDEKVGYERREQELLGRVTTLEEEVRRVKGEVERWRVRCYTVEGMLDWERGERERAVEELGVLRFGSRSAGTEAVPLPSRRHLNQQRHQQVQPQPILTKPEEHYASPAIVGEEDVPVGCGNCTATSSCACMEQVIANVATGCGKCSPDTRCECSELVLDGLGTATQIVNDTDLKRPLSPSFHGPGESKRQRQEEPITPLEIDFTPQFSRQGSRKEESLQEVVVTQPITRAAPIESCGFCKEGTYCACADMASGSSLPQQPQSHSPLVKNENRLPPLLHEVTPPPSDSDVTSSEKNGKLPVWQPKSMHRALVIPSSLPESGAREANPCVNEPGTCKQCLSDPRSGLFCRSLAKLRHQVGTTTSSTTASVGGCCGGNRNGGGCCMDKPTQSQSQANHQSIPSQYQSYSQSHNQSISSNSNSNRLPPPTLSCAQAYQTLSTHSGFDQALTQVVSSISTSSSTSASASKETDDTTAWLGKLNATSAAAVGQRECEGRAAMEVEAASVMEVLKLFDRRFGRG